MWYIQLETKSHIFFLVSFLFKNPKCKLAFFSYAHTQFIYSTFFFDVGVVALNAVVAAATFGERHLICEEDETFSII